MSDDDSGDISDRKEDHIELTTEEDVEARSKSTLLGEVEFFHDSLPELSVDDVDLSVRALGKRLGAPLVISGMTGGADRAREINRKLARVASEFEIAFGVGSQRAMLDDPSLADTYRVRDVAPDILLFGNIGAVQVVEYDPERIAGLVESLDADALCVHLNPGQELMQPEGDRDFRGCVDAIGELDRRLSVPVIAKETGCGISAVGLDKLSRAGIEWVDTSGAGGTTWIGVETFRTPPEQREVGEIFWDWGVPTAACIVYARRRSFDVIGSGGLRTGLDAARALALGAKLAGMALPWIRSVHDHGIEAARRFARTTVRSLQTACMLTGSATISELRDAPTSIGPDLERWLD
ncbi:MAG: type 2 isopentenyl-diphosphate Delta-isomerase, partial [Bradymonadaceae bacterium]